MDKINKMIKAYENNLERVALANMRAGATGILGAVLEMCNAGKSLEEIKQFCETSLNLDSMKQEESIEGSN